MELKKAALPREVRATLEKEMAAKGYLPGGYVSPDKTVETEVRCPLCGKKLSIMCGGNSYQITCPMHGVVASARGI